MIKMNSKTGKVRLVTIVLIIIILVVIEGVIIVNNKKNKSNDKEKNAEQPKENSVSNEEENVPEEINAKAQILRRYNFEDIDDEIAEEFGIREEIIIHLSENDEYKQYGVSASDITILEITEDYVKISRDAIKYDTDGNQYTEEVVEEMEYDKSFELLIDATDPNGAVYEAARYSYYMKFVK